MGVTPFLNYPNAHNGHIPTEMELEKKKIENGNKEKKKDYDKKDEENQLGGLKTVPFILANEVCDRFAATGFHANMITYLTQELNLPLVHASNILSTFSGTASFTPLLGALMADSFAGRFWTITLGTIIYEMGLISITLSAILPKFRPPPCPTQQNCVEASSLQLWVFYLCLLLTILGTGGIRPNVVTFGADQIDMTKSKVASRSWNFFNWYYISMGMATLAALTIVVYIQDNVGWGWGLGIPTIAMALSIIAFVLGSTLYKKVQPAGSPLTRLAQIIVAAVKKRKVVVPSDSSLLYKTKELDAPISIHGRLLHTDQFKWLDKAAVVTDDDDAIGFSTPDLWRLSTVHRVEELKSIIRMLPIWAAGILLVTSHSHQSSFVIQQARSMDRHLSHTFQIPPASMSIFSNLTILIGLVLYERLFVPCARRFTKNPAGITCLQRMGIGFAIGIMATIVAGLVEIKRKDVAAAHDLDKPNAIIPISVFWLVPQYCLSGIAEVFMSVGHLEFLYDQSPESMRSTAAALYWVAISVGNYLSTMIVSLVHNYTGKKRNWLPDRNLNRGRLGNYYWLMSGIQAINLIYYVICAWFYTYKPLEEEESENSKQGDVQMANHANGEIHGEASNGGNV